MQEEWKIRQRYDLLKQKLSSSTSYPRINSFLNLPAFIKANQSLHDRLLKQLNEMRKQMESIGKKDVKIKTTPYYLQSVHNSTTNHDEDLSDLKSKNEVLKTSISRLRQERSKKIAFEAPLIIQRQKQLKEKRQERQQIEQYNKQLKRAIENQDLLELYEVKCRQCQSLRIVNNQLSEELKGVITELNTITGNQENPNMFLLTLGIR